MPVRAKLKVVAITPFHTASPDEVCTEVRFMALYGDDPANKTWSKYTPSGDARLVITNPTAIEQFELGKSYYLDFAPAD